MYSFNDKEIDERAHLEEDIPTERRHSDIQSSWEVLGQTPPLRRRATG